jgi:hypothetical protein
MSVGFLMTQLLGFKPLQLLTFLKVECCVPTIIASMCYSVSTWTMMCSTMEFHYYCCNTCQSCLQCSKTFDNKNTIKHKIEATKLSILFSTFCSFSQCALCFYITTRFFFINIVLLNPQALLFLSWCKHVNDTKNSNSNDELSKVVYGGFSGILHMVIHGPFQRQFKK